ncbi:HD-GYP domain-containing protein [Xylophilus sp. GW821-FHT01B05]
MLKKIAVDQLRTGMYLHKLGGSWLQHPFWRSAFVLESLDDLRAVRECGIEDLWIDTAKGLDVESAPPVLAAPVAVVAAAVLPRHSPAGFEEELERARGICALAGGAMASMFTDARMGRVVGIGAAQPLVEDIAASVARNPAAFVSMVRLKALDDYTYMHSVAVCALMVALGQQLGWPEAQVREAGMGGLMHDLGKALMPLEVLNKPGSLTEHEFGIMKGHPEEGWRLLREAGTASETVCDVALHHHEKYDGAGYPHQLAGEGIGVYARMGALCDVYDAVTSLRSYKAAWDPALAMRRMASWKGHFDPVLTQAFIKSVGIYPVGSLVRLASQRLAVVVEPNAGALLYPRVKVFYSAARREPLQHAIVDLSVLRAQDKIVGVEDPQSWGFGDLDALWLPR